jgi:hypothetical protein
MQQTPKPHFHVLFTSAYGLNRTQLEVLNHDVRQKIPESFPRDPRIINSTTFLDLDGPEFKVYTSTVRLLRSLHLAHGRLTHIWTVHILYFLSRPAPRPQARTSVVHLQGAARFRADWSWVPEVTWLCRTFALPLRLRSH